MPGKAKTEDKSEATTAFVKNASGTVQSINAEDVDYYRSLGLVIATPEEVAPFAEQLGEDAVAYAGTAKKPAESAS